MLSYKTIMYPNFYITVDGRNYVYDIFGEKEGPY